MINMEIIYNDAELVFADKKTLKMFKNVRDVYFFLPFTWAEFGSDGLGNKAVNDPLTIYWNATCIDDTQIIYKISFSDLIKDFCQSNVGVGTEKIRKKDIPQFEAIKNALQKEIDFLNKFIDNATD